MVRDLMQLKPRDVAEAVSMWLDGFDTAEIAAELKTRETIIYKHLPKWRAAVAREVAV